MAQVVGSYLAKENVPPGQKPRRMKMVVAVDDEDGVLRFATPKKKEAPRPALSLASVSSIPIIPLADAPEAHDSDDDVVVVVRPRSPRSPSPAIPPAIAEEAMRVLQEVIQPPVTIAGILSTPDATPVEASLLVTSEMDIPFVIPTVDEPMPPAAIVADERPDTMDAQIAETTSLAAAIPQIDIAEIAAARPVMEKELVAVTEPDAPQIDFEVSEEKEVAVPEVQSAEEVRAEELAARSVARIEAEAAAQTRRTQLEAKLAELNSLNIPHSEAASQTRYAVEERMAAVEEAWRKKIESKNSTQLISQVRTAPLLLVSLRAGIAASRPTIVTTSLDSSSQQTSSADAATALPQSPSIDQRKQRIERLKAERMEMKQRLENSQNGVSSRRNAKAEKKNLRWADDAGDKLTMATNYLVSSGDRIPLSVVPPPLPELPAPMQLPARFLEPGSPSALAIVDEF